MARLVLSTLVLILLLLTMTVSALQVGAAQPPPTALIGLDACQLPCWNGIVPRETSLEVAKTMLTEAGYRLDAHGQDLLIFKPPAVTDTCPIWLSSGSGFVKVISLVGCPGVHLGDLLAILGTPEGILQPATGLMFREGNVVVMVRSLPCDPWFSPQSSILSIYFVDRNLANARNQIADDPIFDSFQWLGFASQGFYSQHNEQFPACT